MNPERKHFWLHAIFWYQKGMNFTGVEVWNNLTPYSELQKNS